MASKAKKAARTITAEIPDLPPSLWKAYRPRRNGGKYMSQEARSWCDFAAIHLRKHRPKKPMSGHLSLNITLVGKDQRRWDVENRVKVLSDLLTRMRFWGDDSQVWDLRVRRELGTTPTTRVEIAPLCGEGG